MARWIEFRDPAAGDYASCIWLHPETGATFELHLNRGQGGPWLLTYIYPHGNRFEVRDGEFADLREMGRRCLGDELYVEASS
jgi:hypothetical protein